MTEKSLLEKAQEFMNDPSKSTKEIVESLPKTGMAEPVVQKTPFKIETAKNETGNTTSLNVVKAQKAIDESKPSKLLVAANKIRMIETAISQTRSVRRQVLNLALEEELEEFLDKQISDLYDNLKQLRDRMELRESTETDDNGKEE